MLPTRKPRKSPLQSGVMIRSPVNFFGTLRVRTCSVVWRINASVVASDASGWSRSASVMPVPLNEETSVPSRAVNIMLA